MKKKKIEFVYEDDFRAIYYEKILNYIKKCDTDELINILQLFAALEDGWDIRVEKIITKFKGETK